MRAQGASSSSEGHVADDPSQQRIDINNPAPVSSAEGNDFITLPRAAFEEGIRELEAAQLTSVATKLKQAVVETASINMQSARSQELDALVSDLSAPLATASADLSSCHKTQSTDVPEPLVHTETALQSYKTQLAHSQQELKQLAAEVRAPYPSLSLIFIRVSLYCSLSLNVTVCIM